MKAKIDIKGSIAEVTNVYKSLAKAGWGIYEIMVSNSRGIVITLKESKGFISDINANAYLQKLEKREPNLVATVSLIKDIVDIQDLVRLV